MALASQALKYNYVIIQPIGGEAVDLTGHLQYIEYFENIMSPTISMNMKISSSFNFVSNLPIRGGEMISMEVETLSGTLKFGSVEKDQGIVPGSGELYVYKLENLDQPSMAQSFTLKITSPEFFTNENLTTKRPGTGISPMMWDKLIGQKSKKNFKKDQQIKL